MGLRSASSAIIQPYFADNMHNDTAGNSNSYVFLKTQIYNFHLLKLQISFVINLKIL